MVQNHALGFRVKGLPPGTVSCRYHLAACRDGLASHPHPTLHPPSHTPIIGKAPRGVVHHAARQDWLTAGPHPHTWPFPCNPQQVKRLVASIITQRAKGLLMRTLTALVWGLVSAGVLGEAGTAARAAARAGHELPSGGGGDMSLRDRLLLLSERNARRVLSPDAPAPLGLASLKARVAHHVSSAAHSGHTHLSTLVSSGMLLVLQPGDPFVQPHTAAVLVRGSLVPGAAPAGSGGANGKHGASNDDAGGEPNGALGEGGESGKGGGAGTGDQPAVGRHGCQGVHLCIRGLPHTPASGTSGAAHGGGPGDGTTAFAAPSVLVWGPTLVNAADLEAVGVAAQLAHVSSPPGDEPLVAGPLGAQLIVA